MDSLSDALLIFIRNPIQGKVKTRLAADIGDARALTVYKRLIHHTLEETRDLPVTKYIYYSDAPTPTDPLSDNTYMRKTQQGDHLGMRMMHALEEALCFHRRAILIGSDIADLDTATLRQAFDALRFVDVVLGPAWDGGYYLIGCKAVYPDLFQDISWGTPEVYCQTLHKILSLELHFKLLMLKSDIDTLDDLIRLGWSY